MRVVVGMMADVKGRVNICGNVAWWYRQLCGLMVALVIVNFTVDIANCGSRSV